METLIEGWKTDSVVPNSSNWSTSHVPAVGGEKGCVFLAPNVAMVTQLENSSRIPVVTHDKYTYCNVCDSIWSHMSLSEAIVGGIHERVVYGFLVRIGQETHLTKKKTETYAFVTLCRGADMPPKPQ
jgi:hypothetical protein